MGTLLEAFRRHVHRARLFRDPGDQGGEQGVPTTAVLAVSGGPDSVALLDLMGASAHDLGLRLVVAHADHGIRPDAGEVARKVRDLATGCGLPFVLGELRLDAHTSETVARGARYAWLRTVQRQQAARFLVTAHHRDDQIETVLMRVLRGSAPAGLAGMRAQGRGGLVRPLLPFPRAALAAHVAQRGLPTQDDPANRDPRHLRSWVRVALIPALVDRLGARVTDDLVRLGRYAAWERGAWDAVLELLPGLELRVDGGRLDVARDCLVRYDDAVAVAVLRGAARRVGLVLGPRRALAVARLARGASGREIALGGGWVAETAFDRLRIGRPVGSAGGVRALVPGTRRGVARFGEYTVEWRPETAPERLERGGWTTWITGGEWALRSPTRGDRVMPLRGVGRREVRRLLSDAHVPRPERAAWPIVTRGATVLWVPGICRGAEALPQAGMEAVRLDVTRNEGG